MSTALMAECWPLQMPPTAKAVLISLADNANDQGYCWPSIAKISERTCFSKRAVIDAIAWLEEHGALTADRSNGRHTTYVITPSGYSKAVQDAHRCSSRTGASAAHDRCSSRTQPVRQVHTNRQEPSRTVRSEAHTPEKVASLSKASKPKAREQTYDEWMASIGEADAIPIDDPIFRWAEEAGISRDWLHLAWLAFDDRYTGQPKRYADWRKVFRNAVKGDWLKVWRAVPDGFVLTTVGEQMRRVRDGKVAA